MKKIVACAPILAPNDIDEESPFDDAFIADRKSA